MRTSEDRRKFREKKIKQRENILKNSGERMGTLYEKHTEKIKKNGSGYMAKHGTLLHYARGTNKTNGRKVRDRNSYSGTENWSHKDLKQIDSMNFKEKEELVKDNDNE